MTQASSPTQTAEQTPLQSKMYELFHEVDALRSHGLITFVDDEANPMGFFHDLGKTTRLGADVMLSSTIHVAFHQLTRAVHGGKETSEDIRTRINELVALLVLARYQVDQTEAGIARVPLSALE